MDTSTDYVSALNMPIGMFLDCYDTLAYISEQRNEELEKNMKDSKKK